MALFGSSSSSSSSETPEQQSSAEIKNALLKQVQTEAAVTNARALVAKLNENCFDRCISTPGNRLSSAESSCLSACMEKYISMWNATSKAYLNRVTEEQKKLGGNAAF